MLAELMRLKYGIAIAGMHGKTTTTSMVAAVLAAGGLDPTVVIGGRVDAMGSNARVGKSEYFVAEADESDRSFLKLWPILAVVTNIDREHMDCYRDMADVERTFVEFLDHVPFYGMVVACNDNDDLRRHPAPRSAPHRHLRHARRIRLPHHRHALRNRWPKAISLPAPFACSTTAATSANFNCTCRANTTFATPPQPSPWASVSTFPSTKIREGLANFNGVDRRFQLKGRANGVTVIDDYGHHPTEIRATLAAARQCGFRRIHVIFQPHRYTRTQLLFDEFATAFADADTVTVLDIYAASEASNRRHHRSNVSPSESPADEGLVRALRSLRRPKPRPVQQNPATWSSPSARAT